MKNDDHTIKIDFVDKQNRIICTINNDKIMICRYEDMDQYTKDQLIYIWGKFQKKGKSRLKKFLDFKSNENEFCS